MSTALLAVAENSWVSSSKRSPHPWRPTLEVSNANSVSCFCRWLLLPLLQETQDYKRVQQVAQASKLHHTQPKTESLLLLLVPVYYPLLMSLLFLNFFLQIQFLYFDLKLRLWMFCKIPGFAVAVKFMRLSCHVLCFVFSISHVSVTWYQIESLFFCRLFGKYFRVCSCRPNVWSWGFVLAKESSESCSYDEE